MTPRRSPATSLAAALLALVTASAVVLAPAQQLAPGTSVPSSAADVAPAALVPATAEQAAQRLAALEGSDRVSTEVIGTSVEGREIVMVTLTAPETASERRRQARMRDLLLDDPAAAAQDRALARTYRLPVMVTANVHGDEYEGTDAALRLLERWARSEDPEVLRTLRTTRLHLVLSVNPDGRAAGTRANAAGFDLNRDLVTLAQPETLALRDAIVRTRPVLLLDLHGYVDGTLVEPTTAPHGEGYELDLLLPHAYANALAVEEALLGLDLAGQGVRPPQIPLRDLEEGWDGWPPVFVPQYAGLQGAVAQTVELPLRVNQDAADEPPAELARRSAVNTRVALAAVTASLTYVVEHRDRLLADQVEVFRRGAAGEPRRPLPGDLLELAGAQEVPAAEPPRAYVVPAGAMQRSAPAAARLVEHLLAHGVEVTRLERATRVDGRRYAAGSHVVDLHQPLRGLAQTLLGPGTDLSGRVAQMYDISGWSLGLLWGADVETVPAGTPLPEDLGPPAGELASPSSAPPPPSDRGWVLPLLDPADVTATGALLDAGVALERLEDGSVLVPPSAAEELGEVVRASGVAPVPAPADASGPPLERVRVGVAAPAEERWALEEMGVATEPVAAASLGAGQDLSGLDVLYVSGDLAWADLDEAARAELRAFVGAGGGLVGRGADGASLNAALDLLDVTAVAGPRAANGVVRVEGSAGPVTGGAPDHSFVYAPIWFTDLGDDVVVDQRLGRPPLVAGHWRPLTDGTGGTDDAAGQALVVRGEAGATGSRVVLLGSEPLFRAHPKGLHATLARALLWAADGP